MGEFYFKRLIFGNMSADKSVQIMGGNPRKSKNKEPIRFFLSL